MNIDVPLVFPVQWGSFSSSLESLWQGPAFPLGNLFISRPPPFSSLLHRELINRLRSSGRVQLQSKLLLGSKTWVLCTTQTDFLIEKKKKIRPELPLLFSLLYFISLRPCCEFPKLFFSLNENKRSLRHVKTKFIIHPLQKKTLTTQKLYDRRYISHQKKSTADRRKKGNNYVSFNDPSKVMMCGNIGAIQTPTSILVFGNQKSDCVPINQNFHFF